MNYKKVYDQIIERSKLEKRKKYEGTYYESHHIIPKSLGGTGNSKQWRTHKNIILLTAREHFICHWLLLNMYPDNDSLIFSFWAMCSLENNKQTRHIPSSRIIEYSKLKMSECKKGRIGYWKGKHLSEETKLKIRESKRGVAIHSDTNKIKAANRSKGNSYRLGMKQSEESKQLMSESHKNRYKLNPELILSKSRKMKGRTQKKIKCPYCDKEGGNTMGRWHFENCKFKTKNNV